MMAQAVLRSFAKYHSTQSPFQGFLLVESTDFALSHLTFKNLLTHYANQASKHVEQTLVRKYHYQLARWLAQIKVLGGAFNKEKALVTSRGLLQAQ